MAANTAFGVLPSPSTQLFGGNAGGGSAGAPPVPPKPRPQQGLAPGATPTFAQMQQQGQARPAPAAGMAPASAPPQPAMLSALGAQLNQPAPAAPAAPVPPPKPKRQYTPEELAAAKERFQGLQDAAINNITTAASQWGISQSGGAPLPAETLRGFFTSATQGSGMGTAGAEGGYGANWDENGLPRVEWRPKSGSLQIYEQAFPEDLREVLAAAREADQAAYEASPQYAIDLQRAEEQRQQEQDALLRQTQAQQAAVPMPSIPAYESSGTFGGSSQAQALRARLEQQLNELSQNEAQIQGQSYAALRKAKMDEMGAEFGAQRSQLEEDLARRGLSASTIGGGRYGDLAGQQARATATFEADLLRQQAEAEAKNRQMYLSGMSELAGMAGEQDLGAFEVNLKSRQADADISLRTKELQQRAELEGRSLSLQEARDLATKEYQGGQLQQGYAEIASREKLSASELASRQALQAQQQAFDQSQSALERQLRETMQTRELTSEEKRQLTQITANKELQTDSQTFQAGQSTLERDLRKQLQEGQITADGQRQLAQIEANKALQEGQQTWQAGQTAAGNKFQAEQSKLDRDLRTTLSANELKAAEDQFTKKFGLDEKRFNMETAQGQNQFLATLAATLAPLDEKKRNQILSSLGIKPSAPPGATAPSSPSNPDGF